MKIAVIGSGISGLSSAYYLSKKYEVDLFEKDDHFGGHSYTFDIKEKNKNAPRKTVATKHMYKYSGSYLVATKVPRKTLSTSMKALPRKSMPSLRLPREVKEALAKENQDM